MYNLVLLRVDSVEVIVSADPGRVFRETQFVASVVMNRYGAAGSQTCATAAVWRIAEHCRHRLPSPSHEEE